MNASDVRIQTSDAEIHSLRGASHLSRAIASAPLRYVLDDTSVRMVAETAFDDNSILGGAIDLLRMPAEKIWLEWSDKNAIAVLNAAGLNCSLVTDRSPRRVGILVESDETGRRGEARFVWQNEFDDAELSPFIAEFDFDRQDGFADAPLGGTVRHIRMDGLDCLHPFFRCLRYRVASDWADYYKRYSSSDEHFNHVIERGLMHIAGDLPFAAAFFLVLSSRTAFESRNTSFEKLNRKRAKMGKNALLDFIELRMSLTPGVRGDSGQSVDRAPARLHHVNGHLVRRGDALFWRRAHLRGNPQRGAILAKTITITATPSDIAA